MIQTLTTVLVSPTEADKEAMVAKATKKYDPEFIVIKWLGDLDDADKDQNIVLVRSALTVTKAGFNLLPAARNFTATIEAADEPVSQQVAFINHVLPTFPPRLVIFELSSQPSNPGVELLKKLFSIGRTGFLDRTRVGLDEVLMYDIISVVNAVKSLKLYTKEWCKAVDPRRMIIFVLTTVAADQATNAAAAMNLAIQNNEIPEVGQGKISLTIVTDYKLLDPSLPQVKFENVDVRKRDCVTTLKGKFSSFSPPNVLAANPPSGHPMVPRTTVPAVPSGLEEASLSAIASRVGNTEHQQKFNFNKTIFGITSADGSAFECKDGVDNVLYGTVSEDLSELVKGLSGRVSKRILNIKPPSRELFRTAVNCTKLGRGNWENTRFILKTAQSKSIPMSTLDDMHSVTVSESLTECTIIYQAIRLAAESGDVTFGNVIKYGEVVYSKAFAIASGRSAGDMRGIQDIHDAVSGKKKGEEVKDLEEVKNLFSAFYDAEAQLRVLTSSLSPPRTLGHTVTTDTDDQEVVGRKRSSSRKGGQDQDDDYEARKNRKEVTRDKIKAWKEFVKDKGTDWDTRELDIHVHTPHVPCLHCKTVKKTTVIHGGWDEGGTFKCPVMMKEGADTAARRLNEKKSFLAWLKSQ